MILQVHAVLSGTKVNGPGVRTAVWTRGCTLGCHNCWNPETWAETGGTPRDTIELAREVAGTAHPDTRGVTLSGGEPFEQAVAAAEFLRKVKRLRPDWDTFCWTGFTYTGLSLWPYAKPLLDQIDLLVDGRYVERLRTDRLPWRGSSNQKLVALTERGKAMILEAPEDQEFEAHFDLDGKVRITGFPPEGITP